MFVYLRLKKMPDYKNYLKNAFYLIIEHKI